MLCVLLLLTAVLHSGSSLDGCQKDKQCLLCTVTGPTVIGIEGKTTSVPDRCAYTLMKTPSIPNIEVYATFQERRRKDVSFLDRVILRLPRVHIYLDQGGRVQVNSTLVTLNATARLVHGVALSKDLTGVTAKITHLKYTMTVFFDGYTAQMHITGPKGQVKSVEGLCGNTYSLLKEARLCNYSAPDCETQYKDSVINCDKKTLRCNLLKEAPFTTCHSHIDPEPYVKACNDTLCKYPVVDGLNCQFLEAYARACSLYSNGTLDSWRSKANCSNSPRAFCQDRFCSAHEFCGDSGGDGGGTRCHCRAIFASTYRSANTLGNGLVCKGVSRSLSLVGCLLEDKGIRYSDLHLYEKTCRAEMDSKTHMATFYLDGSTDPCGTIITMNNNSQLVNKNSIISETTGEQFLDFSCPAVLPEMDVGFSVNAENTNSNQTSRMRYFMTAVWNFTLTMEAYTDSGLNEVVGLNAEVAVNQRIWFAMRTEGLDDNLVALVTDSCFATSEPSAKSSPRYDLIIKGCPNAADKTVRVESNGRGTSNYFSFAMFRFIGKPRNVYLHCKLRLCIRKGCNCIPNCGYK